MLCQNRKMPKSLILTYISVFAALNALADFLPISQILGYSGSLTFGWILSPLTGILLGMEIGGVSCLVGGVIAIFLGRSPTFGPFTPLTPAISAFVAGTLVTRRWHISAATLSSLILIWLLLPVGREASIILVFHIAALAMILLVRGKFGDIMKLEDRKKISWRLFLIAYCGNISRHLFGNIMFATILNQPALFFVTPIPYTFAEQLVFALGTMIIGTSLARLRLREFSQRTDS